MRAKKACRLAALRSARAIRARRSSETAPAAEAGAESSTGADAPTSTTAGTDFFGTARSTTCAPWETRNTAFFRRRLRPGLSVAGVGLGPIRHVSSKTYALRDKNQGSMTRPVL